jgi:hypothetical protein
VREPGSEGTKRRGAGWYVGAAVFWLLAFWLVGVGLASIIPEIFWPGGDPSASAQGSCDDTLRELRDELLTRASKSIERAATRGEREELSAWLEAWDHRLQGANATCNQTERKAVTELARLRFGMSGLIQRFDLEQTPHIKKIDALLEPRAPATAP